MKRFCISVLFIALAMMQACTDFQEEDTSVSFSVDVNELTFTKPGSTCSLTVNSGVKWDVNSMPEWINLQSINRSGRSPYEWTAIFSASENDEYDRNGTIIIKAGSDIEEILVAQEGKKGKYIAVESVSLSPTELNLAIGEYATLTYTVSPANASNKLVSWKSSSPSIATVDSQSGRVDAIAEGTTLITVTTDDGKKTAECKVKVNPVEVSSISLNKNELTLDRGKTETLIATITPDNASDKNVTWSSSNTTVATVDQNGLVTAIQKGTATITAICGGKSSQCAVTVVIPVESITLDTQVLSLFVGEHYQFQWTISPADASNKTISWSSSNQSIVSISTGGEVTALKAGNATIYAEAGSIRTSCSVTVQNHFILLSPTNTVTIEENGSDFSITVDSSLEYYIDFPSEASSWISYSKSGNHVYSFSVSKNETYASRSALVYFRATNASLYALLTITQKAASIPDDEWDGTIAGSFCKAGSGTKNDPYIITTCSQVARLAQEVNAGNSFSGKYFSVLANLNFASKNFTPIGTPDHPFSGLFNGNGKQFMYVVTNGYYYQGFFGYTSGATINDMYVRISTGSSEQNVGGIAGYASNTTITNCCTYGKVNGLDCVGSLVGYADAGVSIRNCYSACQNSRATIYGSVGGLVGYNCGEIINCHFYGSINATSYSATNTGGVVGYNHTTGKMSYCYFMSSTISIMSQISYCGTLNWGTCDHCGSYNTNGYISGQGYVRDVLNSWVSSHQTADHFYREWTGGYPNFVY